MNDDELLERRRAINRRAATKSRRKQKEKAFSVKQQYHEELSKNTKLNYEKTLLKKELESLKKKASDHIKLCPKPENLTQALISSKTADTSVEEESARGMGYSPDVSHSSSSDDYDSDDYTMSKCVRDDEDAEPHGVRFQIPLLTEALSPVLPEVLLEEVPGSTSRKRTLSQASYSRSISCPFPDTRVTRENIDSYPMTSEYNLVSCGSSSLSASRVSIQDALMICDDLDDNLSEINSDIQLEMREDNSTDSMRSFNWDDDIRETLDLGFTDLLLENPVTRTGGLRDVTDISTDRAMLDNKTSGFTNSEEEEIREIETDLKATAPASRPSALSTRPRQHISHDIDYSRAGDNNLVFNHRIRQITTPGFVNDDVLFESKSGLNENDSFVSRIGRESDWKEKSNKPDRSDCSELLSRGIDTDPLISRGASVDLMSDFDYRDERDLLNFGTAINWSSFDGPESSYQVELKHRNITEYAKQSDKQIHDGKTRSNRNTIPQNLSLNRDLMKRNIGLSRNDSMGRSPASRNMIIRHTNKFLPDSPDHLQTLSYYNRHVHNSDISHRDKIQRIESSLVSDKRRHSSTSSVQDKRLPAYRPHHYYTTESYPGVSNEAEQSYLSPGISTLSIAEDSQHSFLDDYINHDESFLIFSNEELNPRRKSYNFVDESLASSTEHNEKRLRKIQKTTSSSVVPCVVESQSIDSGNFSLVSSAHQSDVRNYSMRRLPHGSAVTTSTSEYITTVMFGEVQEDKAHLHRVPSVKRHSQPPRSQQRVNYRDWGNRENNWYKYPAETASIDERKVGYRYDNVPVFLNESTREPELAANFLTHTSDQDFYNVQKIEYDYTIDLNESVLPVIDMSSSARTDSNIVFNLSQRADSVSSHGQIRPAAFTRMRNTGTTSGVLAHYETSLGPNTCAINEDEQFGQITASDDQLQSRTNSQPITTASRTKPLL